MLFECLIYCSKSKIKTFETALSDGAALAEECLSECFLVFLFQTSLLYNFKTESDTKHGQNN